MVDDSKTMESEEAKSLIDRVVHVSRVAKVVKGGRRFSFSALVVTGDGAGRVGYGLGKAAEVPEAIKKAAQRARKNMLYVLRTHETISHDILGRYGAARVLLRAAGPGTGVIAGGVVRAVVESAGIHNILSKCIGTSNPHNVIKATFDGLKRLRPPSTVLSIDEDGTGPSGKKGLQVPAGQKV